MDAYGGVRAAVVVQYIIYTRTPCLKHQVYSKCGVVSAPSREVGGTAGPGSIPGGTVGLTGGGGSVGRG